MKGWRAVCCLGTKVRTEVDVRSLEYDVGAELGIPPSYILIFPMNRYFPAPWSKLFTEVIGSNAHGPIMEIRE